MLVFSALICLAPIVIALRPRLPVHPYPVIGICLMPWIVWATLAIRMYENARKVCGQPRENAKLSLFVVSMTFCLATEVVAGIALSPIGQPILSGQLGSTVAIVWALSFFYMIAWAVLWLATSISRMAEVRFEGVVAGIAMIVGFCLPLFSGLFDFRPTPSWYHMPGWFLFQSAGYLTAFYALLQLNQRVLNRMVDIDTPSLQPQIDEPGRVIPSAEALEVPAKKAGEKKLE